MTSGTTTTTWSLDPVGNITYFHQDVLGNVVALTNHSGALIQQYRYTVWGEPQVFNANNQSRPISEARSPFLFTAREYDLETRLYHYRARAYLPALGRFLQFDPIDFGGDNTNIYHYVAGNSLNRRDPSGLVTSKKNKDGSYTLEIGNCEVAVVHGHGDAARPHIFIFADTCSAAGFIGCGAGATNRLIPPGQLLPGSPTWEDEIINHDPAYHEAWEAMEAGAKAKSHELCAADCCEKVTISYPHIPSGDWLVDFFTGGSKDSETVHCP